MNTVLRIKQLRIEVETKDKKKYGTNILFKNGLNIIRANNSAGKSTCIEAIVYALGLETIFGNKHHFKPVLNEYVGLNKQPENQVIDSNVYLEVTNESNEIITIKRSIISKDEISNHLVVVYHNSITHLDKTEIVEHDDYFVHGSGSASHKQGFHYFLVNFIGWTLPNVLTYDGREVPLYMQCFSPLLFVEQLHGWSSIQANFPTYFRIKEIDKRSVEFLLDLDIYTNLKEKEKYKRILSEKSIDWKHLSQSFNLYLETINATAKNLPVDISSFSPEKEIDIKVISNDELVSLDEKIQECKAALTNLESVEKEIINEKSPLEHDQLIALEKAVKHDEIRLSRHYSNLESEKVYYADISKRLDTLDSELEHNKDILKIKKYGSVLDWDLTKGICPTCNQNISDSLIEDFFIMPLDENVSYIKGQIETFKSLKDISYKVVEEKELILKGIEEEVETKRIKIRALKKSLIADNRAPSYSNVYNKVLTNEKIRKLENAKEIIDDELISFKSLYEEWKSNKELYESLPIGGLSKLDIIKLKKLENSFLEQVKQYGFDSSDFDSLEISLDSYLPISDQGFNLPRYKFSASDNVRIIWSYILGLLETAYKYHKNHIGFVIFDEPQQQGTNIESFERFVCRAATSFEFDKQVILTTSEDDSIMKKIISPLRNVHYINIEGKIIKPIT